MMMKQVTNPTMKPVRRHAIANQFMPIVYQKRQAMSTTNYGFQESPQKPDEGPQYGYGRNHQNDGPQRSEIRLAVLLVGNLEVESGFFFVVHFMIPYLSRNGFVGVFPDKSVSGFSLPLATQCDRSCRFMHHGLRRRMGGIPPLDQPPVFCIL